MSVAVSSASNVHRENHQQVEVHQDNATLTVAKIQNDSLEPCNDYKAKVVKPEKIPNSRVVIPKKIPNARVINPCVDSKKQATNKAISKFNKTRKYQ
jgi:hypothetical protein